MNCKILIILLCLALPFSWADPGCFFHPDSQWYCQMLTPEEAVEECSFFGDCQLHQAYFPGKDCQGFEQCQKVLCKSSCASEYRGLCHEGEASSVPEWCTPGCCKVEYFGHTFCEPLQN